jgi:hypothetical protein
MNELWIFHSVAFVGPPPKPVYISQILLCFHPLSHTDPTTRDLIVRNCA